MRPACALLLFIFSIPPAWAGLRTDILYGESGGEKLLLDVFTPDSPGPFPATILVHGGGFIAGDKATLVKPLFAPLEKAGYAWFSVNYRLAPKFRFPAATDDVAEAVRWVSAHAGEYHVDPKRLALIGESAGGHLVNYVGVGKAGKLVRAVVTLYGPADLVARARDEGEVSEGIRNFLGTSDPASPLLNAKVPYNQSVIFRDRILAAGGGAELYTVPDAPHGIGGWEKVPAFQAYKAKMIEWLNAILR